MASSVPKRPQPNQKSQDTSYLSEREYQQKIRALQQQLANLEAKLLDPSKLINTKLVPLLAKRLQSKLVQSWGSPTQVISPIIAEVIEDKVVQDKEGMSRAIAPIIATAIVQQRNNSPQEIATALAPEIATAIQQQTKLDPEGLLNALTPIIVSAIHNTPDLIPKPPHLKTDEIHRIISQYILQNPAEITLAIAPHVQTLVQQQNQWERQMMINRITPIIDQIIRSKIQQDKTSLGDAFAPVLPLAISQEIANSPQAIAQAIAPEIAHAIKEQIKLEREAMIDALYPIIGDIIARSITEKIRPQNKKSPPILSLMALGILLIIGIPWGINQYSSWSDKRLTNIVSNALQSDPDLSSSFLDVETEKGWIKLSGIVGNQTLVQKAEKIARTVGSPQGIENNIVAVEFIPNQQQTTQEVQQIQTQLNRYEDIEINAESLGNQVRITGNLGEGVNPEAIIHAFEQIPGIQSVTHTFQISPLEISTRIYFDQGSDQLPSQDLQTKLVQVEGFLNQHPGMNIRIIGYLDELSEFTENQELAQRRAIAVKNALVAQGVDPNRFQVLGQATSPPDVDILQSAWLKRTVVFEPITP